MYHDAERFKTMDYEGWLNCQHGINFILSDMGRHNVALELALKSVYEHIQEYGYDHEETFKSQKHLGEMYRMTGKIYESDVLRKVMIGFKKNRSLVSLDIRVMMDFVELLQMQESLKREKVFFWI